MESKAFSSFLSIGILLTCVALTTSARADVPTALDKYNVLQHHNRFRCQLVVPAKRMPAMTWDDLLYQVAQNYANKDITAHNPNRSAEYAALGGSGYVGENLFWASNGAARTNDALTWAVDAFGGEKAGFVFKPSSTCGGQAWCGCTNGSGCGHYTQVVWADTTRVGCAAHATGQFNATTVLCNYAPGGNYVGAAPYEAAGPTDPVLTEACLAARKIPLDLLAHLDASSRIAELPNVYDSDTDTAKTFWAALYPTDTATPWLAMTFAKPMHVDDLVFTWMGPARSPRQLHVTYSTADDGSNPSELPVINVPQQTVTTVHLNQSNLRYVRITFTARQRTINGTVQPYAMRLRTLEAIDNTLDH